MKAGIGFSCDIDQQLMKEANVKEEKNRFVALVWDEMNKHTCNLVGFTNIGQTNDELDKVQRECEESLKRGYIIHALLFMV